MRCEFCFEECLNAITITSQLYHHGLIKQRPMCPKCFATWVQVAAEIEEAKQ